MATIKQERVRNSAGKLLEDLETQTSRVFSSLDATKIALNALKTKMQNKPAIFTAGDVTEVDDAIAVINAKYTP